MKHYTDIDPTVDFVFPVNKIDREKGEKTNLKLTKCVLRSCNLRTKYVFTSKDHCNVHHFVYCNIASVVASCNTNNFFSVPRFSIRRRKKSAKIKCLLIRPKPQKLPVIRYYPDFQYGKSCNCLFKAVEWE